MEHGRLYTHTEKSVTVTAYQWQGIYYATFFTKSVTGKNLVITYKRKEWHSDYETITRSWARYENLAEAFYLEFE